MNNKAIALGGLLTIDGIPHKSMVLISPIGELVISVINLATGLEREHLVLDAVAAFDLHEAQNSFYRGEFEEEMSETL